MNNSIQFLLLALCFGHCVSCDEQQLPKSIPIENSQTEENLIDVKKEAYNLELRWRSEPEFIESKEVEELLREVSKSSSLSDLCSFINTSELLFKVCEQVGRIRFSDGDSLDTVLITDEREEGVRGLTLGWHSAWAEVDSVAAVKSFIPNPKSARMPSDAPLFLSNLGANSDWAEIDGLFSMDRRGFTNACRAALFKAWMDSDLTGALDYLANRAFLSRYFSDALLKLYEDDEASALSISSNIVEEGSDSAGWDGVQLFLMHAEIEAGDFSSAFERVYLMNDPHNRGVSATQTYAKWMKVDLKAAEAARIKYQKQFPPKQRKK